MPLVQGAQEEETLAFVEQLEGLGAEIRTAMEAIAGNRLAAFEQSVSRQEFLCGRLRELAAQLGSPSSALRSATAILRADRAPANGSSADRELATRVRSTGATLQALNLQYAALLRHSGQSMQMMATLTNNYTQRQAGSRAKHQTWSCEG